MQFPEAKLNQVRRILALWPPQAADDGEELLRGYLLAVEDYHADDVHRAVDTLIKGTAPGVNPSFRPKPPEVGAECRRQMNLRLDREHRAQMHRPKLPPPDIERTPESQARVRALVEKTVRGLRPADEDDPEARHKAQLRKANGNPIDPLTTYSGVHHDSLDDDYSYDGMIAWRVSRPWPAAVVAISGNLQTQDR